MPTAAPQPSLRLLAWEQRRTMPWRNGGGTTHEIASSGPAEDFDWRLSVAEVEHSGPFSSFTGVDRVIMLLNGEGMSLTLSEGEHELREREPFAFSGDDDVTCTLRSGPTRDLNVMTRRGRSTAQVTLDSQSDRTIDLGVGQECLLFVLDGEIHTPGVNARALDCIHVFGPGEHDLHGEAVVVTIALRTNPR